MIQLPGVQGVSAPVQAPPKLKRFKCERCDRRFSRLEHLQRHDRTHTQEKPFKCTKCQQRFSRSDLLVRHERLNHIVPRKDNTHGEVPRPMGTRAKTSGTQAQARHEDTDNPGSVDSIPGVMQLEEFARSTARAPEVELLNPPFSITDPIPNDIGSMMGVPYPSINGEDERQQSPRGQGNVYNNQVLYSPSMQDLAALMDTNSPLPEDFVSFLSPSSLIPFVAPQQSQGGEPQDVELESAPRQDALESFSRLGSRLPSLEPQQTAWPTTEPVRSRSLFESISSETRQCFTVKLSVFSTVVSEHFHMPSRLALSRYLTAFLTAFHEHLPFLHIPTMTCESCYIELVLAIASVGAQACFESEIAVQLFEASHTIAKERMQRIDSSTAQGKRPMHKEVPGNSPYLERNGTSVLMPEVPLGHDQGLAEDHIQTAQALLLLMAEATWSNHRGITRQALAIQSTLASLAREDGLRTILLPADIRWEKWAKYESTKRTKWIIFCFFNLHTIVHDVPPLILSSEMNDMLLPCHAGTFRAPCETTWLKERRKERNIFFKEVFRSLFEADSSTQGQAPNSTLGNYVLIHALIQHIYLIREVSRHREKSGPGIPEEELDLIELALKNWKSAWKQNPESSLNPANLAGPVSFNSTALLRLAYIRLNADIGPGRALHTRDPMQIANAFLQSQAITRTPRLLRAVLHAIHALSVPIRIGVRIVAQTQTVRWSIQHSLATLECAFFLSKWLVALSSPLGQEPITASELSMLRLVKTILDETDYPLPSTISLDSPHGLKQLATNVLRVWEKSFHGPKNVWGIVDVVGESLEMCANFMDRVCI